MPLPHFGLLLKILLFHRSEEHTSELQSRSDLVCRLLLEKKKAINRRTIHVPQLPQEAHAGCCADRSWSADALMYIRACTESSCQPRFRYPNSRIATSELH